MYLLRKPRGILALGIPTAGIIAALMLLNGGRDAAIASNNSVVSNYSILSKQAPSTLAVVQSGSEAREVAALHGGQPVLVAEKGPGALGVEPASVQEASLGDPNIQVWVGKTTSGGICVLAMVKGQPGSYGPASSCTTQEGISKGAQLAFQKYGQKPGYLAGVVPNGVSSIAITLSNGSTVTASVVDNAYAVELQNEAVSVAFSTAGLSESSNLGGR